VLGDQPARACQWKDGKIVNLGVLPGFRDSIAIAVNEGGLIAGRSYTRRNPGETPEDYEAAPCVWKDGKIVALGTFGGPDSYANGLNKQGQVVGRSHTKEDEFFPSFHAFVWENGKLHDLNDLIPAEQKARWVLRDARAINDRGQVLVVGQLRSELHNVLLEPVTAAATP